MFIFFRQTPNAALRTPLGHETQYVNRRHVNSTVQDLQIDDFGDFTAQENFNSLEMSPTRNTMTTAESEIALMDTAVTSQPYCFEPELATPRQNSFGSTESCMTDLSETLRLHLSGESGDMDSSCGTGQGGVRTTQYDSNMTCSQTQQQGQISREELFEKIFNLQ